jgi:Skp family chaperone for outer membrane proteins
MLKVRFFMYFRFFILVSIFSWSLWASTVEETELAVAKWLAVEKEKSQAKRDWQVERGILESEMVLEENQCKKMKQDLALSKDAFRKSQQAMKLAKSTAEADSQTLSRLDKLYLSQVTRFRKEIASFPLSLQASLVEKLKNPSHSLKGRFLDLLDLIESAKLVSKQWHLVDQAVVVDSHKYLCQVLYAGVSRGFAVTRNHGHTFVGSFHGGKWVWKEFERKEVIIDAIRQYQAGGVSSCRLPFFGGVDE